MDVHTDGQILPVFFRTLSPSGPLPKNKQKDVSFSIMGGCHRNTSLFLLKCEYFKQRILLKINSMFCKDFASLAVIDEYAP